MHRKLNLKALIESLKDSIVNQRITHMGNLKIRENYDIRGYFCLPEIGHSFALITQDLNQNLVKGDTFKVVKITGIIEILNIDEFEVQFKTLHSVYHLTDIRAISDVNNN